MLPWISWMNIQLTRWVWIDVLLLKFYFSINTPITNCLIYRNEFLAMWRSHKFHAQFWKLKMILLKMELFRVTCSQWLEPDRQHRSWQQWCILDRFLCVLKWIVGTFTAKANLWAVGDKVTFYGCREPQTVLCHWHNRNYFSKRFCLKDKR